jgi:transcriptional regulator with XRE-family HTH domain
MPKEIKYDSEKRIKKQFGERLEKLIKANGITKKYLAEKIDVDPNMVSRWVKGQSQPTLTYIDNIMNFFSNGNDPIRSLFPEWVDKEIEKNRVFFWGRTEFEFEDLSQAHNQLAAEYDQLKSKYDEVITTVKDLPEPTRSHVLETIFEGFPETTQRFLMKKHGIKKSW